ncbi:MAG: hypothetical protein IBX57_00170 [Gammaproteobacteria bacterium]|nr:hypothetical protein [Gammaproteobacteria bacterium]
MSNKKVPSLTTTGWLTEISDKADALMAYYITSEKSQSYVYSDSITSLPYHIAVFGDDLNKLETHVQRDLTTYFGRYFDKVEVTIEIKPPLEEGADRYNLEIDAFVVENGFRYNLGRQIQVANKKVTKVFEVNNGERT